MTPALRGLANAVLALVAVARAPVGETATAPVIVSGTAIDESDPPPVPDGVIVDLISRTGAARLRAEARGLELVRERNPVGEERAGLARVDDLLDVEDLGGPGTAIAPHSAASRSPA